MTNEAEEVKLRKEALERIKKKQDFAADLLAYVVVNLFLVVIWATVTGAGFFWPIFPILGWGIGVIFHAFDAYRRPPSEADISREIERLRR